MIEVAPYTPADAAGWDELVDASPHGTFQHARRFLDYHGDRFVDLSLVFRDRGKVAAVLPAARSASEPATVVSHPGATFGGLVTSDRHDHPAHVAEMVDGAARIWREAGLARAIVRPPPNHLLMAPAQSEIHALWLRGATVTRRDLWNVIPTDVERGLTKGHKWSLGRARKAGLALHELGSDDDYAAFHAFLAACLAERHQVSPVHAPSELLDLRRRLGDAVALYAVRAGDDPALLAASWVFRYGRRAWHTQYIASNLAGRDNGATVFLLESLVERCAEARVSWFSFGASTEAAGREVNHGLFAHKAGFGPGSVTHDTWTWELDAPGAAG